MTNETTWFESECPEEVLRLLPWFSEGNLEDEEQGLVEAHVAGCRACRDELKMIAGDADASVAPDGFPSPERVYGRVRERIEARAASPSRRAVSARRARRPGSSLAARGRSLALAASMVGAALVAGVLLSSEWAKQQPSYQPASERGVAAVAAGPRLDVIFRGDVTANRINEALRAIGGTVVAGPAEFGRYRIELPSASGDADLHKAARILRLGSPSVSSPSGSPLKNATSEASGGSSSEMDLSRGVAVFAEPVLH